MSKHKISSVVMYVIVAISILVMLFFYVGPRTVDIDELDSRIEELTAAGDVLDTDSEPVIDNAITDSTAMAEEGAVAESDSALMEESVVEETVEAEVAAIEEIDLKDHLTGWELLVYKRTDYALGWAYILILITALASILFPVIYLATNLKALLRVLAVLAGSAILFLLSYFVFASDTPIDILGYAGTDNSDPGVLKMVGTGLFATYILFGLALLSILYSEVAKLFK